MNTLGPDKRTPLHLAVLQENPEIVKLLLKFPNIQIDLRDHNEMTAYDLAKKYNQKECKVLLSNLVQSVNNIK